MVVCTHGPFLRTPPKSRLHRPEARLSQPPFTPPCPDAGRYMYPDQGPDLPLADERRRPGRPETSRSARA
eukprot:1515581-Prymnesium_polylepis.1